MKTLFEPCQAGRMALANRVVMAPLTRDRAGPGHVPTPLMATSTARAVVGFTNSSRSAAVMLNTWLEPVLPAMNCPSVTIRDAFAVPRSEFTTSNMP